MLLSSQKKMYYEGLLDKCSTTSEPMNVPIRKLVQYIYF